MANQILHICIFIKPNVWYSSLKILTIKRWFLFNFANILQGHHFVVGGPKNVKFLADISFDSSLQKTVLPSLLLFLCACYYVDLGNIQWDEVATSAARNFNIVDPYTSFFKYNKPFPISQIFDSLKIPNISSFFYLTKKPPKENKFFIFLKGW